MKKWNISIDYDSRVGPCHSAFQIHWKSRFYKKLLYEKLLLGRSKNWETLLFCWRKIKKLCNINCLSKSTRVCSLTFLISVWKRLQHLIPQSADSLRCFSWKRDAYAGGGQEGQLAPPPSSMGAGGKVPLRLSYLMKGVFSDVALIKSFLGASPQIQWCGSKPIARGLYW